MLTSSRRSISYPNTDRSDRPDIPAHILNLVAALEIDMIYSQGTNATRTGRAHLEGVLFFETDTGSFWYDDGAAWWQIGGRSRISIAQFRAAPYSTAPYDNQLVTIVIPVTLTTPNAAYAVEWSFRYDSVASIWRFVGGEPLIVGIPADDVNSGTSNSVWYDPTTAAGPTITTPLDGVFRYDFGALVTGGGGGSVCKLGLKFGASAISDNVDTAGVQVDTGMSGTNYNGVRVSRQNMVRAGTRTQAVKMQTLVTNNATTTHWAQREIAIYPIQVAST